MGLLDQFRFPTGHQGRIVASAMNRRHWALTTWGLTHVTIQPDFTVLDVGCGGGITINRLSKLAPHGKVYGIDYSPDMVAYAKKLNKKYIEQGKVVIVEAQADKTGFPNNFFDLTVAIEAYYFWPNLANAFQEINRVLKPNGKFLIINEMIKDGVFDVEQAGLIEKTHVHLFSLKEIQNILEKAGFVFTEVSRKEQSPWNTISAQKTKA
jgi:ubiquinone/menaquinone biosynthesis C-methylase UbiE